MYETLKEIAAEYDEPSPADLWDEAATRWKPLLAAKRPQTFVEMLREELMEEYGERSAFLILMILMYMLVAMFRPSKDSPYHPYCQALAEVTQGHPLLERLWEGVRQTEDEEERAGRRIGIVTSLLTEIKASGETLDLDTIEQCILRFPTFELQQKALEQADNLLRGTAWSSRSDKVFNTMLAKQKEQQNKQEQMNEDVRKGLQEPRINVFPQADSTTNIGCDQKGSDFKTYMSGTALPDKHPTLKDEKGQHVIDQIGTSEKGHQPDGLLE